MRKISFGEGVERVFPLFSPSIESISVVRSGQVRRAKLYYLRELTGKKARIVERIRKKQPDLASLYGVEEDEVETAEALGDAPDVENEILEQKEPNEASTDAEQKQEASQTETSEETPENVEENKE